MLDRCLRKVGVQKRVDEVSRLTRIKDQHLVFCRSLWKGRVAV